MPSLSSANALPSVRRQRLLVEFASLKHACPQGVYVSISPGDPTAWTGVVFVRKGPYSPAILRFKISFPPTYPASPPLIVFTSDIFHPLLSPLTTYTYTTGLSNDDTVSATEEERLPPGGFSLRHGFPHWFRAGPRSAAGSAASSRNVSGSSDMGRQGPSPPAVPVQNVANQDVSNAAPSVSGHVSPLPRSPLSQDSTTSLLLSSTPARTDVSVIEILLYLRSAFDDEVLLDAVPFEAAGNPGAWHAWRTHRRLPRFEGDGAPNAPGNLSADDSSAGTPDTDLQGAARSMSGAATPRRPGEWNWEGVWQDRVRKGIEGSLAEPVLYGQAGAGTDLIRFLNMEEDLVNNIKENIRRTVEARADG